MIFQFLFIFCRSETWSQWLICPHLMSQYGGVENAVSRSVSFLVSVSRSLVTKCPRASTYPWGPQRDWEKIQWVLRYENYQIYQIFFVRKQLFEWRCNIFAKRFVRFIPFFVFRFLVKVTKKENISCPIGWDWEKFNRFWGMKTIIFMKYTSSKKFCLNENVTLLLSYFFWKGLWIFLDYNQSDHRYGSTGCWVFMRGVQNEKDGCLRINMCTQRKSLNFEYWCSGELSKIGHYFSNKVVFKNWSCQ